MSQSTAAAGNLDSFVRHSRPPPQPVAQSQEIRDRGSTFFGTIFQASSPEEARARVKYLKCVMHGVKPASHEISAWRCMVLKPGCTGLAGPEDFEVKAGFSDDGEQWAGNRVLKVMQNEAVIDAVVIVSRYYGGHFLGPVRFNHIETCAREVCQVFKRKEELEECITSLSTLDEVLAQCRSELAELTEKKADDALAENSKSEKPRKQDYSTWTPSDIPKAKRLIVARERSIASVNSLIAKKRDKSQD